MGCTISWTTLFCSFVVMMCMILNTVEIAWSIVSGIGASPKAVVWGMWPFPKHVFPVAKQFVEIYNYKYAP